MCASNEYLQYMFSWRNKKKLSTICGWKQSALPRTMDGGTDRARDGSYMYQKSDNFSYLMVKLTGIDLSVFAQLEIQWK